MKSINPRKKSKVLVDKAKDGENFHKYVCACLKIAWKMVAQRPKMTFDIKGNIF